MKGNLRYLAVTVLVAVAVVLGIRTCGRSRGQLATKANSLEEAVAHELGRLVQESVESSGAIVLIQTPALDDLGVDMNRRIRSAFERGLGGRSGDVEEIELEAGRSRAAFEGLAAKIYNGRWASELAEWMRARPDAAAVANLNPLPAGVNQAMLSSFPPLFTVLPMLPEATARQTVSDLGLGAGLLPREAMSRPGAIPRNGPPEELFNAAYQVLSP